MKMFLRRCLVPLFSSLAMICAVAVGMHLHNPSKLVSDSFGRALSSNDMIAGTSWDFGRDGASDVFLPRDGAIVPTLAASGSTSIATEPQMAVLVVGDEVMLRVQDQDPNLFRVLAVEPLPAAETRFDTSLHSTRKLLVTARDLSNHQGRVVRFIIEIEFPGDLPVQRAGDQLL